MLSFSMPFIIGGLSGCIATTILQPIDTVKVRIQIISEEISAGLSKDSLKAKDIALNIIKKKEYMVFTKENLRYIEKFIVHQLQDFQVLQLVILQIQHQYAFKEIRCYLFNKGEIYKNVFDALKRIVKDEGLLGLWKGCTPTVIRSVVLNLGMLSTFDEVKERLNQYNQVHDTIQIKIMFFSSTIAGIIASIMSLPFDNIKTKLQRQQVDAQGNYQYKGFTDCFSITARREGIRNLWIGFPMFASRTAPHIIISLLIQDYLNNSYKNLQNKQ
ncbi:mitochondrial carrier protein, putative [Ichthyophthirius multifiliis]|uniref:Mitochondrial carrier protein, putative n=1 Tax=Ichthyophthirius multifiliis TaxID=5932 RepID=G0QUH3_ICHMU|nr:mitochondrial carrier protein, putative [Ichthyophthirius multifiliis]EGR31124.1 mitochondrial carrier protein, putative [Ichthyophthirius multifiliis]|eukprot:XP_004034610.1 mitochondrial carrier protein, putative [Ichthyophthirius multifiliis]